MHFFVEVIVGVNKYQLANEDPVDVLSVDNTKVRESQVRIISTVSYHLETQDMKLI